MQVAPIRKQQPAVHPGPCFCPVACYQQHPDTGQARSNLHFMLDLCQIFLLHLKRKLSTEYYFHKLLRERDW